MSQPPTSASVSSAHSLSSSPATTAKDAIDNYLAPYSETAPTSFLEAAVRDSNAAIKSKPPALWLGTLGYLVAVEQVGHCIQLKSEPQRSGQGSVQSFVAAAREFGDSGPFPRGDTDRKLLYAVRSALAHEYGLFNDKKRFTYARATRFSPRLRVNPPSFVSMPSGRSSLTW